MAGGSFTANLNSNGLKLNVKNYKLKNNNINLDLHDADSSYENIDYTTSEENINTNLNTNDFDPGESISKASNQSQEIKSTQEEEKPWWDVVFDYAATAVGSVVSGVVDVVENIGDGLIMCGGELASGVASLCGNEDLASEIKKGTQDIVQYDWSEAAYDAAMDALDVDDEIAHGAVHQVGNALGSMAGYAALSLVPGGAAVTAATGFLAAKGSSAEHAFQSGATFEEASVTSTVAGAAGALSGAALNKVQGAAKGATSIKEVAKLTAKGMAVSATEPAVNSVTEYATYGKDMVDENGNPLYDNFGEYYVESGGLLNTVIATGVGGISTGSQAIKGYKNNIATTSFVGQTQLTNDQTLTLDNFNSEKAENAIEVYKSYDNFIDAYNDFGNMDLGLSWDLELSGKTVNEFINDDNIDLVKRQALQKFCETTEAGRILSKLTFDELKSCRVYSGEAYGPINTYLRKGSTTITSESYIKTIINDIDSAMAKADPIKNDMLLYRGVDFEKVFSSHIKGGDINSLIGQTISDKAYMSTSAAKDAVRDYNTIITIKTSKGTKALNMFAINGNREAEFLLDKNSKLFIEGIDEVFIEGERQYNIIASLKN